MKEFMKFEAPGAATGVLVCTNFNKLMFWCEYETRTAIGVFHDHCPVSMKALDGKTAAKITLVMAIAMLKNIAAATRVTSASRYANEINDFISKEILGQDELPF